jgi:hypothetical protein
MTPADDRRRAAAPTGGAEPSAVTSRAIELPVGRAFLVQLASDCDPNGEAIRGRVEHVRSGEASRFCSLPELAAFMLGVLGEGVKPGG